MMFVEFLAEMRRPKLDTFLFFKFTHTSLVISGRLSVAVKLSAASFTLPMARLCISTRGNIQMHFLIKALASTAGQVLATASLQSLRLLLVSFTLTSQ